MQYKSLAKTKTYVLFFSLALCLNLIFSINTRAQQITQFFKSTNLIQIPQDEPSKRFGSEPTYQPSTRYMPKLTNTPSKRLGSQQVGEASLEIIRRKMVKSAPGPEELVAKADKFLENEQVEKAIELYRSVISSSPKTTSAQLGLGNALLEKGDYKEALKELTKTLELLPNSLEGQINFGVALYRSESIDESIEHYEKILSNIKDKEYLAAAYYNLAVAYSHKGNFKKAVSLYQDALNIRESYPQAYNNLGLIYEVLAGESSQENTEEGSKRSVQEINLAKESFLTAIKQRKGEYPLAYYNLGRVYANLQERKEAISMFLLALKQKPNFAEAHLDLGSVYLLEAIFNSQQDASPQNLAKFFQDAMKAFQKALEIRQGNYPLAHENIGIIFSKSGNPEEAYLHYRKAIDQYTELSSHTLSNVISTASKKTSFSILHELSHSEGSNNLRKEDPKKRLSDLLSVLELYENLDDEIKDNQTLRYCVGQAYASIGDWESALDEFTAAIELSKEKDQGALDSIKKILSLVKYY